jgi:hypothetical protein
MFQNGYLPTTGFEDHGTTVSVGHLRPWSDPRCFRCNIFNLGIVKFEMRDPSLRTTYFL